MFLLLLLVAVSLALNQCESGVCSTTTTTTTELLVMRNGGNNTGTEPVLRIPRTADTPLVVSAALVRSWALQLGYPRRWQYALFSARGLPLAAASPLPSSSSSPVFVVPHHQHWIWPGLYVGYTVRVDRGVLLRTLSLSPRLFEIDAFLSGDEAAAIVQSAEPKLSRASVAAADGQRAMNVRTSSYAWLDKADAASAAIEPRVLTLLRLDARNGSELFENMQVVHYDGAQRYESHYDYFPPEMYADLSGDIFRLGEQRMATLFFYLNDVEQGGQTVFPLADVPNSYRATRSHVDYRDCSRGLRVQPRRGKAVLWYNTLADGHMDGARDVYSLHGACPLPANAQKWGANFWVRNKRISNEALAQYRAYNELVVSDGAPDEFGEPHGFVFQKEAKFWQVLRTESNAIARDRRQVTVRVYANGGVVDARGRYVQMNLPVGDSPRDIADALEVAPVALGMAHADLPATPCFSPPPWSLFDANGTAVRHTRNLVANQRLYLRDTSSELWLWPVTQRGERRKVPLSNVEFETLAVGARLLRVQQLASAAELAEIVNAADARFDTALHSRIGGAAGMQRATVSAHAVPELRKVHARLAKLFRSGDAAARHIDTVSHVWRLDANRKPYWLAHRNTENEDDAFRLATLLQFYAAADNASASAAAPPTLHFPLANQLNADQQTNLGGLVRSTCSGDATLGVSTPASNAHALLLHHSLISDTQDERADIDDVRSSHIVCPSADSTWFVIETAVWFDETARVHAARPAQDWTPPKPAYTLALSSAHEDVFGERRARDTETIDVSVSRVGENGTPWLVKLPLVDWALASLRTLAGQRLGFAETATLVLFDSNGLKLNSTVGLRNGARLYVAPSEWQWIWPAVELGHRVALKNIPRQASDGSSMTFSRRMELETVSVHPRVFRVKKFVTARERAWLLDRGNQTIDTPMDKKAAPQSETEPMTTWLFVTEYGDMIDIVDQRIAALMRVPASEEIFEALVVERYVGAKKQHRKDTPAFFDVESGEFGHLPVLLEGVNRLAGVYIQLQDADEGGDIVFPAALHGETHEPLRTEKCGSATTTIDTKLEPGDALLFYTLTPDQHMARVPIVDRSSVVSHCPVTAGEKWGAYKFLFNKVDRETKEAAKRQEAKEAAAAAAAAAAEQQDST